MELMTIIIAALAPAAVLLYFIWKKDSLQQEPVKELLRAFGMGVASVFVSLAITSPVMSAGLISADPQTFWQCVADAFLGAAIPEEIAKFLMFWLLVRKSRFFDERMDGIVYASCVALGFAGLENIMYLINNYEDWVQVGITRAIFSVPGHFFFGVLMGYFYSLVRFDPTTPRINYVMVLAAPMLAHGLFNSTLMVMDLDPSWSLLLMVAFLWGINKLRKLASQSIAKHLEADGVVQSQATE